MSRLGQLRAALRRRRLDAPPPEPVAAGDWERLAPAILASGPGVIGATGGSGTRVFARVVRQGGMFVGADLNKSDDSLSFAGFSDRWINDYVAEASSSGDARHESMEEDLRALVVNHCRARPGGETQPWGWKEPRSIYLLPFFAEVMPGLRFLHVVRDGRDMAFSGNQVQLRKHGEAVLAGDASASTPLRSIALWREVNLNAADTGERLLGERYLRLRFEDLCNDPVPVTDAILRFFDLSGDAERIAHEEVHAPDSLGRWRNQDPSILSALHETAGDALRRFGYDA